MCEPCSLQNKTERAVFFCRNCIEKYCEPCSFTHKAHKVSREHDIVTFDDTSQNTIACEPCNYRNTFARPSDFCKDCEEYLCKSCTIEHRAQKQNKNHNMQQLKNALNCEPCLVNGKTGTAVKFCLDCKEPEPLCASCADIHIAMKRTRDHRLSSDRIYLNRLKPDAQKNPGNQSVCQAKVQKNSKSSEVDMASTTGKQCEPCNHRGMEVSASHYCQDCDERYCENCMQKHAKSRQSKKHDVVDISQEIENCKPCLLNKVITHASHFCKDCAENLCNECTNTHTSQKLTRNHKIIPFQYVDRKCEICESAVATSFCKDCDDPDLLCELCAEEHTSMKQNRGHKVSSDMTTFISFAMKIHLPEKIDLKEEPNQSEKQEEKIDLKEEPNQSEKQKEKAFSRIFGYFVPKEEYFRSTCDAMKKVRKEPEKPYVAEKENMKYQIHLKWEHKEVLCDSESYEILFKESKKGSWKVFNQIQSCRSQMVIVDGLQADTSYVFKVRVIDEITGYEGLFSPESNLIKTDETLAHKIMKKSEKGATGPPDVYMLPIKENKAARNEIARTRKFTLGSPGSHTQEKTIMIVGATGSGKSTLINNMANYVMGVTWEDPFRFTLVNLETCEQARTGNEALSQTEWITMYTIYNDVSSRINYTINLIDTPGFGDTRGITQDAEIVSQIRQLFTAKDDRGVTVLDAVCFIVKAPDARLTTIQTYIYESILALFGKDIVDNICTLVTFADGNIPPVLAGLAALPEKPLPYKVYFPFNNSALFVNNTIKDQESLLEFFWDMGLKSCEKFFVKILSLETRSLLLTSEVLTKRQQLENTILHLQQEIDKGLIKINSLEQEVEIFTKFERQINENKDFEYTVEENKVVKVDISGQGIYTTTCLVCNNTCHNNCAFANDADKARCIAMSPVGSCKICPKKCHWQEHSNVPYIYKWETNRIKKSYSDMLSKYEEASKEKLTKKQLIQKMNDDIIICECGIQVMIEEITTYTNRLKDIALRPDPLSTVAYIELMIESEKLEKKSGFRLRIKTLEECKKRAQYGKSYQIFADRLQTTRNNLEQSNQQQSEGFLENAKQRMFNLLS